MSETLGLCINLARECFLLLGKLQETNISEESLAIFESEPGNWLCDSDDESHQAEMCLCIYFNYWDVLDPRCQWTSLSEHFLHRAVLNGIFTLILCSSCEIFIVYK